MQCLSFAIIAVLIAWIILISLLLFESFGRYKPTSATCPHPLTFFYSHYSNPAEAPVLVKVDGEEPYTLSSGNGRVACLPIDSQVKISLLSAGILTLRNSNFEKTYELSKLEFVNVPAHLSQEIFISI